MTTAQDLINSSAKQAGILAEGQALEAGINTDALSRLNRLINRLENDGISLGLATPLVAADTLIIDDADEEALELQLTLRLMLRHRRPIQPGLSQAGDRAITELQAKYALIPEMTLDRALTRKVLPRVNEFDSGDL
jgi:hypothetical protein